MRPDEHKKKKNTQYKKNHGLNSESKAKTKSDTSEKQSKEGRAVNRKLEDGASACDKTKVPSDNVPGGDSDEHSYSKRKLVSNWSRYEDLSSDDDEALPAQRGEDFNKLLAEVGGSAAQFRFRDEEDWSGMAENLPRPGALALDLEEIAQSLTCLPVHQRLDINQNLFTGEQLQEINTVATDNQSKYNPSEDGAISKHIPVHISSDKNVHNKMNFDKGKPDRIKLAADKTKNTDSVMPSSSASKTLNTHTNSEVQESRGSKTSNDPVPSQVPVKSAEISSLEDDLDALLSMDENVKDNVGSVPGAVTDDSRDKTSSKSVGKDGSQASQANAKEPAKEENLEDWLDSMLDD